MNINRKKKYLRKRISMICLLVLLLFCYIYIQALFTIPNELFILNGEDYICNFKTPLFVGLLPEKQVNLRLNGNAIATNGVKVNLMSPFTLSSNNQEKVSLKLKLFGFIPLKTMVVEVVPNKNVIPCGNTIGVKIFTQGALIVGTSKVDGLNGKVYEPYKVAGLKQGDYIIEIENQKIINVTDVVEYMENYKGENISIKINRNNSIISTRIQPVKGYKDNKYKMGLWLRDSTAGIGTMTFYDPDTKVFGALGHGIADVDTGNIMNIQKGEILYSNIVSVKRGLKGSPGELRGMFIDNKGSLGQILDNCECGIFGIVNNEGNIVPQNKPMPIALRSQIKEGPAQIISNISGKSTNVYNIEIQKIYRNSLSSSKSMVIKITDERLLNYTGGIVQGMSGSPIIQNGRLVGAVTHVLVNDPTRGYGVFIEWMIQRGNTISPPQSLKNAS